MSSTTALLGAATQLGQFIIHHSDTLTEKGVNPEALRAKVTACCASVQTAGQTQADAKTSARSATKELNDAVTARYPEFSSVIDLLRGVVGNNTPLGRQLTNIRKQANRRSGRSTSTTDTPVKLAA